MRSSQKVGSDSGGVASALVSEQPKPSVTFCERGGARKRADVFLQRKTEQSELCSDVVQVFLTDSENIGRDTHFQKYSISQIMGYLKGKSAMMNFKRHANLKFKFGNRNFWATEYYVSHGKDQHSHSPEIHSGAGQTRSNRR